MGDHSRSMLPRFVRSCISKPALADIAARDVEISVSVWRGRPLELNGDIQSR